MENHCDPLLASVELAERARVYPLGFPLWIRTNSRAVLRAACESWGAFSETFAEDQVVLEIGVSDDGPQILPPTPVFRSREHLLSIVSDSANFMICDLYEGFGYGWLTNATASRTDFLRYYFLDPAALVMIEQLHLAPIHGALVQSKGKGVLLCGKSFAGKSTLAYACARAGWTLISDDGTFLRRKSEDRFGIGNPYTLRFRDDARNLFPELRPRLTATRPNGKESIEVPTRELPGIVTSTGCAIDHIVLLNRHAGGCAGLQPIAASDAAEQVANNAHYGLDTIRKQCNEAYQRLLTAPTWQLNYGPLDSAVARLNDLVTLGI